MKKRRKFVKQIFSLALAAVMTVSTVVPAAAAETKAGTERVNYALGKTITASYSYNDTNFAAGNAVDGDMNTRWASEPKGSNQWLCIDLGKETTFDEFKIANENSEKQKIRKFKIEGSHYDDEYEMIYDSETNEAGFDLIHTVKLEEPVRFRYVRITVESLIANAYNSISLREFEVIGDFVSDNYALGAKVEASEHYQDANYNLKPEYAVDGDFTTRWASKNGCGEAWFTFELPQEQLIDTLLAFEDDGQAPNVKNIRIQYKTEADGEWTDAKNQRPMINGYDISLNFTPVTARWFKVILNTHVPQYGFNINEFELCNQAPSVEVEADSELAEYPAFHLIDGNSETMWKTDAKTAQVTFSLRESRKLNTIHIEEDRETLGKIKNIKVECFDGTEWKEVKTVDTDKLPWNKNIFMETQTVSKVRLTFTTDAEGSMAVREVSLKKLADKDLPADSDLITLEPDVKPNAGQQKMVDAGYTMFVHFGLNTFTESEWTYGDVSPSVYAPPQIDADQWVKTVKEAGMKTILLVTKHHDGFALWDSQYTEYDVGNPESGSHVDVVKAVSDACNKYGINLGLYYSAWDNNWDKTHAGVENADAKYAEYMRNQITELLSGDYGLDGKITELWIDGIWEKEASRWEFDKFYDTVKKLQPECQVGLNNTIGTEGNHIRPADQQEGDNIRYFPTDFRIADGYETRSDDPKLFTNRGQTYYLPFEATLIMNKSWFWHTGYGSVPSRDPASIAEKYNKYKEENNVLVLNCGPNRQGRIEQADIDSLYAAAKMLGIASGDALKIPYTEVIEQYKGENLALGATGSSDYTYTQVQGYGVDKMLDGKMNTRWASNAGNLNTTAEIVLDGTKEFNYISIQEDPGYRRTDLVKLEYEENGEWKELFADLGFDKNGKLELRLPETVAAQKLKLTLIDHEKQGPTIDEFQLYNITSVPELAYEADTTELEIGESVDVDIVDVKGQADFEPIVTYTSENENIAVVDQSGIVTAVAEGSVSIVARTEIFGEEIRVVIPMKVVKDKIEKTTYTVTVAGGKLADGTSAGEFDYNAKVTVTADTPENGMKFAGWKVGDVTVSLNETYTFYVSNEMTLEAVYVAEGETVEQNAEALLTNVITEKREDGKYNVRFVAQLVVPEGCTVKEAGLVWSSKETPETLEVGADGARVTQITRISDTNQFSVTIKGMPEGRFVRGRIFATIKNADGMESVVVYSLNEEKVINRRLSQS